MIHTPSDKWKQTFNCMCRRCCFHHGGTLVFLNNSCVLYTVIFFPWRLTFIRVPAFCPLEKLTEIPSSHLSARHRTCHGCSTGEGHTAGLPRLFDPIPPPKRHRRRTQARPAGLSRGAKPAAAVAGDMDPTTAPARKATSPLLCGREAVLLPWSCKEKTSGVKPLCQ